MPVSSSELVRFFGGMSSRLLKGADGLNDRETATKNGGTGTSTLSI